MSNNGNYQNAYKKASVNTLDQNKLIIMLYDGAIKNASFAVEHMKSGEIEKVHNCLIKAKNIVTASITTASSMSDDIRTQVLSQLQSVVGDVEVQIEERVDESLIGGFVLRVGDREFNASVANKLQKLKREFVSNPYIKEF